MTIRTHSGQAYPPSNYDEYLCLKPPVLLWAAVLYLTRVITLPMAMAISAFAGVNADAIALMRRFWSMNSLIPALFAMAVLYAFCRRVPTAGKAVRWIWARGRVLLLVSAAMDLALSAVAPLLSGGMGDQFVFSLLTSAVDVYFLAYFLAARRVRDTFCEFPLQESAGAKVAGP